MNLIEEIIDKIPDNINTDLEKAFYIYIKTCEMFSFDERLDNVPFWFNISILYQNVDIRNINNMNIVCTAWAKIYKDLLKEIGIDAKIINTCRHRGVSFNIDESIIYADATIDKYMDLSRVKHKEKVNRFYTIDDIHHSEIPCKKKNKEFDEKLDQIYTKLNYLEDNTELIDSLKEKIKVFPSLSKKIDYIICKIDLTTYSVMEDAYYFREILKKCLDEDYYNVKNTFLKRVNDDGTVSMLYLLLVNDNSTCKYYMFDRLKNIRRYNEDALIECANSEYGMDLASIYMLKQNFGFEYPYVFDVPMGSIKYFYRNINMKNKEKEKCLIKK